MIAKKRGETLNNIPGECKAEALLDALAGTLGHIKANIFFFLKVGNVDTKVFINTMHQNQAEVEIETPGDTSRNVDAKHRRTCWLTVEKVCETLTDLKGAPLFKTLAAAVAEVKAKTVGKTLAHVEVEALIDMLADTLEKAVAKRIGDTIT